MIEAAIHWIKQNTLPSSGIIVNSRQRLPYPEVTGYFIPTLQLIGEHTLARQYASWLAAIQLPDGSFGAPNGTSGYAFDTGQVVRGWVSMLPQMPELAGPLRAACDWLLATADPGTGRLRRPPEGGDWSLGPRGELSEGIHIYVLAPLREAGRLLGESRYLDFVDRSLAFYLRDLDLTCFDQKNALTHFYGYIQEALFELGCHEESRRGMASVARYQQDNGAVPGYHDVSWVCSTGLAQLAKVWFLLGEGRRGDKALEFLATLQNPSGGFFGSYGVQADYFPAAEISWATKYAIEAVQAQIVFHFDETVSLYSPDIAPEDGRVQAVLRAAGDLTGKRVLDAGCGKGRYSALLKKLFPGAEITAADVSPEMLKHVPGGITTVQSGILDLPFANGSFDLILCIEALEHVTQTELGVAELTRVLAPGGKLVIIDKNKEKLGALEMPHWEKWFDRDGLTSTMSRQGLQVTSGLVSYEGRGADGLFICWVGARQSAMESAGGRPAMSVDPASEARQKNQWEAAQAYEKVFWDDLLQKEGDFHDVKWLSYIADYFELQPGFDFGDEVLVDIGSGPVGLLTRLQGKHKIAIDPLPIDSKDKSITRIKAPGEETTLAPACADRVFMYNVLQHVCSPEQVLGEIERILKPGATAYIVEQLNLPTDTGHPHSLKQRMFDDWIRDNGFQLLKYELEQDRLLSSIDPERPGSGYCVLCTIIRKAPAKAEGAPGASKVVVTLDSDLACHYSDSQSVNNALRSLLKSRNR